METGMKEGKREDATKWRSRVEWFYGIGKVQASEEVREGRNTEEGKDPSEEASENA